MSATDLQIYANVTFLALGIWREARGEPDDCKIAVGGSVLNRVARPSWWGHSVTEVLFKGWQYSSLTDPKDPQLTKWPGASDGMWQRCLEIADGLLSGVLRTSMSGADGYYDLSIPPPKWATPETFVGQIGQIRFYNLDHDIEAG